MKCDCLTVIINHSVYFELTCSVNMPKIKLNISTVLKKYVSEFGENVFSCDESVLSVNCAKQKWMLNGGIQLHTILKLQSINGRLIDKIPLK